MKKKIWKRLLSAFTAVTLTASTFAAFSLPAWAADFEEATTTTEWAAKDAINAKSNNDTAKINQQSGDYSNHVRMTNVTQTAEENSLGASIGVFKLGQVKAGDTVTVTANFYVTNTDLAGVGLYTTSEAVGTTVYDDAKSVLEGNAISAFGHMKTGGSSAKPVFGGKSYTWVVNTDVTKVPSSEGSLDFSDDYKGTFTKTVTITDDNKGYLYFLAGAWGTGTRHMQVSDITVEYKSSLINTFDYAKADGSVTVLKNSDIGNARVNLDTKNLNISSSEETKTITSSTNANTVGILIKKTISFTNLNIVKTEATNQPAIQSEAGSVSLTDSTVTGDMYASSGSSNNVFSLNNSTVKGKIYTRNAKDNEKKTAVCSISLINNSKADAVQIYYLPEDDDKYSTNKNTLTMDSTSSIGTLTIGNITEGTPDGTIIIKKADTSETLLPSQIETLTNEGYELYTDAGGNLAIREKQAESEKYNIVVPTDITASSTKAAEGETVTLSGDNIGTDSVIVTYTESETTKYAEVTRSGSGYTFTMPAADVTVSALINNGTTKYIAASNDHCKGSWNGTSHYILGEDTYIALGFDLSGAGITDDSLITLYMTRSNDAGYVTSTVEKIGSNPWESGTFNATTAASATQINAQVTGSNTSGTASTFAFSATEIKGEEDYPSAVYLKLKHSGGDGNDYYAARVSDASDEYKASQPSYLPYLAITTPEKHDITAEGLTVKIGDSEVTQATAGKTVTVSGDNIAANSVVAVKGTTVLTVTNNGNGTYSFVMPDGDVAVTALTDTETTKYIVADSAGTITSTTVNTGGYNYGVTATNGLAVTFTVPEIAEGKYIASAALHLVGNEFGNNPLQATNIYKQDSFNYDNTTDAQQVGSFSEHTDGVVSAALTSVPSSGAYKLLLKYETASGNGNYYYVRGTNNPPKNADQLSCLILTIADKTAETTPDISIDYENETLTGFDTTGTYTINDNPVTPTSGVLDIENSYFDTTISIVKKSSGDAYTDSAAQSLEIPARPATPTASDFAIDYDAKTITIPSGYKYGDSDDAINTDGDGSAVAFTANKYIYKKAVTSGDNKAFKSAVYTATAPSAQTVPETTDVTIGYSAETLTAADTIEYSLDDGTTWATFTGEAQSLSEVFSWNGAEKKIKIRTKATDSAYASDSVEVTIPASPAAPAELGTTNATTDSAEDGAITGTTALMEYRAAGQGTWNDASADTTGGLAAGTYDVRLKATNSAFAGKIAQVTIGVADKLTVRFMNNGSVYDTQSVTLGEAPTAPSPAPSKDADAEFTYTFLGWNTNPDATEAAELTAVTQDTDYYAIYSETKNKYNIVWKVGETILRTDNLEYGATPSYNGTPTKDSDDGYDYTFSAWNPAVTTVTGVQTYVAQFTQTARTYSITYNMQEHGNEPTGADTTYTYGIAKSLPTPEADGFTFDGWYKTYNSEDKTYSDKVESISATDYGNLTLYAKWTEIPAVTYKAQIGETKYETFKEAIGAVTEGQTIELLDDVTINRIIFDSKAYSEDKDHCNVNNVTIDGGDKYSITSDNSQNMLFEVNAKTLTFKDITLVGGKLYTVNLKGGATTKLHLINTTITPASGNPGVSFDAANVMLYADAQSHINGIRLRDTVTWNNGTVIVNKETDSDALTTAVAGDITETTGKALYVNNKGNLLLKTAGEADPEPAFTIAVDDSISGKVTVSPSKADAGDDITVTVTGDNYVNNSLTASYSYLDGSTTKYQAVTVTATGTENEYTFTAPAANVTVTALFDDDETTTIIASDDYCYNVVGKSVNAGHYIRNQSDSDEKNLALGFDLGNIDISDKIVKLQIVKTGYSVYSKTVVNLINGNPWATSDFDYTLASGASTNVVADGGENGGNDAYYKCTYTLDSSKLTTDGNKLYLNIERADQASGQSGNDYYAIPTSQGVDAGKKAIKAEYLPKLIITEPKYYNIEARSGITVNEKAVSGTTVTLTADGIVDNSLIVKNVAGNSVVETTDKGNGEYTFVMPESDVSISALVNETNKIYVVPTSVKAVNAAGNATNNYYIKGDHALGMTFDIPELPADKELDSVSLRFTRQNSATSRKTNIYDQTIGGFTYQDGEGYIAQYDGNTIAAKELNSTPVKGTYKLLLAYDSSVASDADGNDYYVVGAENAGNLPKDVSQLPYLVFSFKADAQEKPPKKEPTYELQTDTLNNMFQYHFAGGTTEYNESEKTDDSGKAYDVYLWVPSNVARGELKGLVAIKMNLVEVPFAYSQHLRDALAEKGFGILFLVCQKDPYGYNNTLNGFYTRTDSDGNQTTYGKTGTYTDNGKTYSCWTTDGKDAAQIMDDILGGIAKASGYGEIKDTVPLITIGHSAASGFGNKSANWNKDRIIAQIHMKNGMSGGEAMTEGVPQLQYAAQYTEHAMGAGRDRSVRDARYHITDKRAVDTDYLVSHIIEWGSGHYDWSENATYMLTEYIKKAIDARLPANYDGDTVKLNDLTNTGYLMKPFEKTANGAEQDAGYYRDYLQGWLSSGQNNSTASAADKKASFWFFDKEFADLVNEFTNYAIPESPDSTATGISGATYSKIEPFMLMKDPQKSTYANTPAMANTDITPYRTFATNPFSRYGSTRFINYTKLAKPGGNSSDTANLEGYGTVTVDTYYMNKIPTITAGKDNVTAYDGAGENAYVPENTTAEFVPLIAPYEVVSSEQLDMSGMTPSGDESENVASVTRTTLRFHNDRVYFRSGNAALLGDGYNTMDSYGFIKSPEIRGEDGFVTSAFKATSSQMNVPYVSTGKGTDQTLTLNKIDDVNVNGASENPKFAVTYTSSDADLQKFTDVMVEYGPARAVRNGNDTDGYTWEIEVLLDQIPNNAKYPIEVNVVASNLGKWEKVSGATASQTFDIIWDTPEITGITVTPYNDTYDKTAHDAVTVSGTESGDTVTYKLNDGEFVSAMPQITNAGEYTVTVKVEREDYNTFTKEVKAVISKADMTDVDVTGYTGLADGQAHGVTVTGALGSDTVTYTYDGQETSVAPTFTDIGKYEVKVKISRDNYNDFEKTVNVQLTDKPLIEGITVTPYDGIYDENAHDAVSVSGTVAGDTVTYKLGDDGEFGAMPQITDADTYKVTVKVERAGYETFTKEVTAAIAQAKLTGVDAEGFEGMVDGLAHGVTVTKADGDTVTYTYDDQTDTSVAPSYTDVGSYEVTVKIHRNDNYEDFEKTVTVRITAKPAIDYITVTANSGEYTGNPVDAVTVNGATANDTVTYKLDDGEFTSEVPKVTDVGEYEVTVKATREGYADFVKVVTVTIELPRDNFDEPYTPDEIKGVNEYDEETPLNGWFSNDEETNSTAVNSVKTENGQLIMTNGDDEANLWIGKSYATQEDAEEAAKIIIKFRYTPGNTGSRIYLASASAADVRAGLDSDTVEGTFKTAAELGMTADTTYDVTVTIDNSKHEAVFAVAEKAEISLMSISLMAYVDLTADVPDDTNTVIFRPAAGATDSLDYFSAQLLSEANATLRIGEITQSEDKTTVQVSVENPTEETEAGVMIAALYSLDGVLKEIKTDVSGTVEFNKATEGYVKLFLWTALSGDNAMQPILPSKEKAISTN